MPITAIVVAAASVVIIQVIQSTRTSAQMIASRQVQTAGYWVSRDALQVQEDPEVPESPGFPFTLRWTDWDDSEAHEVVYSIFLADINELQRQETVHDKDGNLISDTTIVVGQYIDPANSQCSWNTTTQMLTFSITVGLSGQSETRIYEVKPRSLA